MHRYIPACGGSETWTVYRDGNEYLYVVDMTTGDTGWLNRADIILTYEQMVACGNF